MAHHDIHQLRQFIGMVPTKEPAKGRNSRVVDQRHLTADGRIDHRAKLRHLEADAITSNPGLPE